MVNTVATCRGGLARINVPCACNCDDYYHDYYGYYGHENNDKHHGYYCYYYVLRLHAHYLLPLVTTSTYYY